MLLCMGLPRFRQKFWAYFWTTGRYSLKIALKGLLCEYTRLNRIYSPHKRPICSSNDNWKVRSFIYSLGIILIILLSAGYFGFKKKHWGLIRFNYLVYYLLIVSAIPTFQLSILIAHVLQENHLMMNVLPLMQI